MLTSSLTGPGGPALWPRMELRLSGADANPYRTIAAALAERLPV